MLARNLLRKYLENPCGAATPPNFVPEDLRWIPLDL